MSEYIKQRGTNDKKSAKSPVKPDVTAFPILSSYEAKKSESLCPIEYMGGGERTWKTDPT